MKPDRNWAVRWSEIRHVVAFGEPLLELQPAQPGQIRLSVGGDVANSLLCLARILQSTSVQLSIATALGSSAYSAWLRKRLKRDGVEIVGPSVPGEPGIYGIPPDHTQPMPFSYWRADSAAHQFIQTCGLQELDAFLTGADLLLVTGITLALCSPESFDSLISWLDLRSNSCPVVFDVNYRAALWTSKELAQARIRDLEKRASVIATSVEDEQKLWHTHGLGGTIERFGDCSAECVIRAGSEGCWVKTQGAWKHVPTTSVVVVDPVGAGDAHLAGYVGARINGCPVWEAAAFANRVASAIVSQRGSAPKRDTAFPALPCPARAVPSVATVAPSSNQD
jgi:2-dehydro-3-deoxygluconokinase